MKKEQNTNEDLMDYILSDDKPEGLTHPSVESEQKERKTHKGSEAGIKLAADLASSAGFSRRDPNGCERSLLARQTLVPKYLGLATAGLKLEDHGPRNNCVHF